MTKKLSLFIVLVPKTKGFNKTIVFTPDGKIVTYKEGIDISE